MWFACTSWVLLAVVQHRLGTAACPEGMFGNYCDQQCDCSPEDGEHYTGDCNDDTGECICSNGYFRPTCDERCAENTYGYNCRERCFCGENMICDHVKGCTPPNVEISTLQGVNRSGEVSSAATTVPVTPPTDNGRLGSATSVLVAFAIMGGLVLLIVCGICVARRCVKTGRRTRRAKGAFVLPAFSSTDSNAALMDHAGREEYSYIDLQEVGNLSPQNTGQAQPKYENAYQLPTTLNHADKDNGNRAQNRDQARTCVQVEDRRENFSDGVYNILHQTGQRAEVKDQYSHIDSTYIVDTKNDKSGDRKGNYNHLVSEREMTTAASRVLVADNYHHIVGKQNFVVTPDIDNYDHVDLASYEEKKS